MSRSHLFKSIHWLVLIQFLVQPLLILAPPNTVLAAPGFVNGQVKDARTLIGSERDQSREAKPITAIVPLPEQAENGSELIQSANDHKEPRTIAGMVERVVNFASHALFKGKELLKTWSWEPAKSSTLEDDCKAYPCPDSAFVSDPFNDRLSILVGSDGHFNMGAFPDPLTGAATANSWRLMYGWPADPWSSFTTLRIDGIDSVYGSSGTQLEAPTDVDPVTNRSKWQIGDVEVTQILKIVSNTQTGMEDVAKIEYTVRNTGTVSHDVGARVMIDTMIYTNDGAPYRVPGVGIISNETEFIGSEIPDYFQVFRNVTDSERIAAAALRGGEATQPDRLVFAHWFYLKNTNYDYAIDPNRSFLSDSAYATYWFPASLAPGMSRSYVTYYGLGHVDGDLLPPLALVLAGPATLSIVDGQYSPNPFQVIATILNNGTATLSNVTLTINLPQGLTLASGTADQAIGELPVNEERQVTWSVLASPQETERTLIYSVTATATNYAPKTVESQITLDPIGVPGESVTDPGDGDKCFRETNSATQVYEGGPINTHTGSMSYSFEDLAVQTAAGRLGFQRTYASLVTGVYTQTLGFGWTHNLESRLVFPGDPGGEDGTVLFKAHTSNRYQFSINADGTYSAHPGLCAALVRNDGPPVTYTLKDKAQRIYTFDGTGKLLSMAEPAGHALNYTYQSGRLTQVSDETGNRYLSLGYDPQGRINSVSDHAGRQVSFGYDATTGDLVSATDVLNEVWTYSYDDPSHPHYLTRVSDPRQVVVERTEYDEQGRAVRQYNGAGEQVLELTYNADGTTTVVDGRGNARTDGYDGRNTLTSQEDALQGTMTKVYDGNFRPTSITDPLNHTTNLLWSASGDNLEQVQDAAGSTTRMTYDDLNNLTSLVDSGGITTTYTYSGTLLLGSTDGLGHTTTYAYTTAADAPQPPGLLKTVTDPLGNTTSYTYDQYGQRVAMTDALLRTTAYAYDDLGRLQTVTDPLGRSNWTCYDPAGRVVRTVANASGDGSSSQSDPCDAANYVPAANPDQDRITTTVYDQAGNAIAAIDPSGLITRTYYDDASRPLTVVQNLVGQAIEAATPPARDPANPDQNIRTDTVYDTAGNAIAAIDPAGVITRAYYDANNRPATVVQNLAGQAIEAATPPARNPANPDQNARTDTVYDPAGNPIAAIDPLGTITRTYYDELNRPVTVVQNLTGQAIEVATPPDRDPNNPDQNLRSDTVYDPAGNPIAIIDPAGAITRTYYDEANRPVTVVQNLTGQAIEATSPPARNPATPDQNVRTDSVYDAAGNAIATIDPQGVVTRTYYDASSRPVSVVRNLVGQAIEVSTPPARNPAVPDENLRTDLVYDQGSNAIATIDPLGIITRTYYDGLSRPVSVVLNLTGQAIEASTPPARNPATPDQNVRTDSVYDATGHAIALIDPLGRITRAYFDGLSRTVTTVQNLVGQAIEASAPPARDPANPDQNARTDVAYDVAGNTLAATDPLGKITRTYFDGLDRPISVVQNLTGQAVEVPAPPARDPANPDQNVRTDTSYDAAGNALAATGPLGAITRTYYDGVYRPVTVVQNLVGQGVEVAAPPARDPASPDQNVRTDRSYDVLGNRVSVADPNSLVTRFEYDGVNRLAAVLENYRPGFNPDHETNVRSEYAYDAGGNRLSVLDGKGHTTTFGYDALGRLVSESDPLAHTTTYAYDAGSRRTATTGATTSLAYDALGRLVGIDYPAPDADAIFAYDAAGQRLSLSDGLGSTAWNYDGLGRVAAVTDPWSGTLGYGYDLSGNRTGLAYPDGKSVSYTFDGVDRLKQVTGWDTTVTAYTYDPAGRQVAASLPNGVISSYNYDSLGRLLALTHAADMETLSSFEYTYDPAGNRTHLVETLALPGPMALNLNGAQVAMADPAANLAGAAPAKSGDLDLLSAPAGLPGQPLAGIHTQEPSPASIDFARLPLSFVPNQGQTDQAVRFQVKSLGGTIFFTPQQVVLAILNPSRLPDRHNPERLEVVYDRLPPTVVRLDYAGANPTPEIVPAEPLPGVVNYLLGNDPAQWFSNVPTYSGVIYRELYPGIDLRFEGSEGHLKSIYHLAPGSDPSVIRWRYNGSTGVSLDDAGDLVISLPSPGPGGPDERTTITERAPLAWQEVDGEQVAVSVGYAVEPNHTVGFVLPDGYDPALPLVIDPELTYSTYLGGGKEDDGHAITVDGEGSAYVTGRTYSTDFPTVDPVMGDQVTKDVFIAKLNPAGDTLLYSTYIGGSGGDTGHSIALDSSGRIAIAGETESTDFPMVGGYDTTAGGGSCDGAPCDDGFVLQLVADGSAIRYSTYIGGSLDDEGYSVAVDANGYLYTVGELDSADMPTLNPYQSGQAGSGDAYFVTVDPAQTGGASLLYATYFGGSNGDVAYGVQVDGSGKAYVAGYTHSTNFPTRTPYQAGRAGNRDVFVAKFDPLVGGDASLLYSTYLGGSGNDRGLALALGGPDQVYVTGLTQSSDFPLANAYDNTYAGGTCGTRSCYDAFVFHLDLAANSLVYSTYLGGTSDEEGLAIAANSSGNAYITGYTKSTDFPVLEAIQAAKGAESCSAPPCEDAFLTKLDTSGSALVYSTYLGGGGDDQGNGIALDGSGGVYIAGEGNSSDFPVTPGAYDTSLNGTKDDVFIVKISEAAPPPPTWTTTYTYTYDPLYRLVGAAYSSGEFFEYAYDAVGNRLSETSHVGTTNYTYDNANRLTGVNGVPYTWDDNGNLLGDGVYTYTYDHANRLISAVGPSSSSSFAYNGLGDRLQQTVDGVTTNYTLDLNNWLTQVLVDGTQTYLYGTGRIAQYNAGGAEYFLADALGSVKQLADSAGGMQLSKTYEPFGEVLNDAGSVATSYGFAGEWTDGYIELLYLRSRMYSPGTGRFLTKDSWQGNYNRPLSLNGWNYVESNPVNRTDPSGHSPLWCGFPLIGCVDTAKNAVFAAKAAYSQVGPILLALSQKEPWNNRFNCLDPRWSKPESASDLLADYFCERGPTSVTFYGNDTLTLELARSILLDEIRKEFYATGDISVPKESKFDIPEFGMALLDAIDLSTGDISFPLTHFLGSFDYRVVKSSSGRVQFQIDNLTDLASGTRIPLRYPPEYERDNPLSLEQVIQEHPEMENMGVLEVLIDYPEIVSILEPRTRQETGFLMGGGNMYQTFKWSERYLDCGLQKLPWPVYLLLLDIR